MGHWQCVCIYIYITLLYRVEPREWREKDDSSHNWELIDCTHTPLKVMYSNYHRSVFIPHGGWYGLSEHPVFSHVYMHLAAPSPSLGNGGENISLCAFRLFYQIIVTSTRIGRNYLLPSFQFVSKEKSLWDLWSIIHHRYLCDCKSLCH